MERLIPEQVQVLGVEGIGTGFGLSLGNRLLQQITTPGLLDPARNNPGGEEDEE